MIDNTEIKTCIALDKVKLTNLLNHYSKQDCYDFCVQSFFRRFVDLEQFVIDSYISYALKGVSKTGFSGKIIIDFNDEDTLRLFHEPNDKFFNLKIIQTFYLKVFDSTLPYINPFKKFFETKHSSYLKMETIRNVIAHKSKKAQTKFVNDCNSGINISIEDYICTKEGDFTIYNKLLKDIEEISELITSPY